MAKDWFPKSINLLSSVVTIYLFWSAALGGLIAGLVDQWVEFAWPWRILTAVGVAGIVVTTLALILKTIWAWRLRRSMELGEELPSGSEIAFIKSVGTIQGLNASENVMQIGPSQQPYQSLPPLPSTPELLQQLKNGMAALSDELFVFISERKSLELSISTGAIRHKEETLNIYYRRFSRSAVHFAEEAARRGYPDDELLLTVKHPYAGAHPLVTVALRLGVVSERIIVEQPEMLENE